MATVTANNNPLKGGTLLESSELVKISEWLTRQHILWWRKYNIDLSDPALLKNTTSGSSPRFYNPLFACTKVLDEIPLLALRG